MAVHRYKFDTLLYVFRGAQSPLTAQYDYLLKLSIGIHTFSTISAKSDTLIRRQLNEG